MAWVESETPPDATVLVLGDTAEWFPYIADRDSIVGPWGLEWTSPRRYATHVVLHRELSMCHTARCLSRTMDHHDLQPTHLYVPKGKFTLERRVYRQPASMPRSLRASERYRVVFENRAAMVVRVRDVE